MHKVKIRQGVVLTEIHGVYLLAADRTARETCPYLREINEIGAQIWNALSDGLTREETVSRIRQEYEIPEDADLYADLDAFIESLGKNHYLICEADTYEIQN